MSVQSNSPTSYKGDNHGHDTSMYRTGTTDSDSPTSDELTAVTPYAIDHTTSRRSILSDVSSLRRIRTNQSELSRILSGIRDDRQQDFEESQRYKAVIQTEEVLASQLELVSRNATRQDITSNLEAEGAFTEKEEHIDENGAVIQDDPPPDGGFGWVIALCACLATLATWGSNAGYGVFLNFYLNSNTFPGATEYDFALIGGIVVFLAQFLAPISAVLYKIFGFRIVCIAGIIIQTAGYMLASFATKTWQLYLTQGVLIGVSFVLVFMPATLIIPTWFDKRKATAMGITISGAGLGGLIFSLSVNRVIEQTGDQRWALRMVGFVTLAAAAIACVVMKPRNYKPIPLSQSLKKEFIVENIRLIVDFSVFKNYAVVLSSLWFAIALLGYTMMLFTLASYATSIGLSHTQGSNLTSILNAAQIVGRPLMGYTADRIGRANLTASVCLIISILLFAFWINATTYATLIAFSVIIGLIVGIGSTMAQPIVADMMDENIAKLPAAWTGMNIFVSFFCLVAEVIALSLVTGGSRPYLYTQIFAGCCFFACFIISLIFREWFIRRALKRRLVVTEMKIRKLEKSQSGYLKVGILENDQTEDPGQFEILEERVERYNNLLRRSLFAFLIRTVYPIRV
ncbi:hypothetical protein G9P44_002687 [Scheffersomyces stipitis]|nr:hypothetical protein G9P44_002687 [Scheffersomyces stipitis]